VDLRNRMEDADVSPLPFQYTNINDRNRSVAFVAQDEKALSERWKLDLGLRFDESRFGHGFVSPRAALIYQRSDWTYKFLYGRGFRDPSAFQVYYTDGLTAIGNPNLRPESSNTFEVDVERRLGKRVNVQASAYGYQMHNFLEGLLLPDELLQYQNTGTVNAEGIELEINGRPLSWLEATASYTVERARDNSPGNILANSPNELAKLRFAIRTAAPARSADESLLSLTRLPARSRRS